MTRHSRIPAGPRDSSTVRKASREEREEAYLRDGGVGALRDGGRTQKKIFNNHPTVKPIDLNRWLASLLLLPAPTRTRRILVPFAGSGSEMIGCLLAGWDEIVGVEQDADYSRIAAARLEHWSSKVATESQRGITHRRRECDCEAETAEPFLA